MLYPLRRTGPKGSGQFERISWDEALDEIADRFRSIAAEFGPRGDHAGAATWAPRASSTGSTSATRSSPGSAPPSAERTYCDSGSCTAYAMTIGDTRGRRPGEPGPLEVHPDLGVQHHEHQPAPVAVHRRGPQAGRKVVVVDPVRTRTAAAADQHIADPAGHRRRARAGDDERDHRRGAHRRRLHRQLHRGLRRTGRAGRSSTRRSGPADETASRPRTSAGWPASTPPRSRR